MFKILLNSNFLFIKTRKANYLRQKLYKALLTIQVNMFLFDGAIYKSIVMMRIPTVIVTQPLDLMKTISREQLSDSRDMGFVHSF